MRDETLFHEARQLPAGERAAFLDEACKGDTVLRQQVDALLWAHDNPDSFLQQRRIELGATVDLSPAEVPLGERAGALVGPYKLLEQIGEGGMGVVYMAEQQVPIRRRVALKVIKVGMDTRQVIARFEAERQALALMDHSNIARVLDAGATTSGRPYFVMELVRGVPITEYCDQNNLLIHERLELFVQVCHAVQHAHQKGIIHRDIKPSNVLVTVNDGRAVPKVIDFGVAKATNQQLTEKTLFTAFEQMVGTPLYMSPEQAAMSSLDVDTRSDIYSLGVLLYELLTGTTPFDQERLRAVAYAEMVRIIREEEPPKPSTRLSTTDALHSVAASRHSEPARLSKDVRGELDWIVMRCLEKDRNHRYETANGLACDIERYLHDDPVLACPPSAAYRFRKFARRNKAPLAAITLVAASLILGLVISIWQANVARRAERLAQTRLEAETAAREQANTETAKATAIAGFLQQMLASANPDVTKGSNYTVRQLLDDFSDGLGDQLADQPEVEAAVRGVIGKAYWRLGFYDRAHVHLKEALDLRRRVLASNDTRIADSLLDYAWNLPQLPSHTPEAEPCAREALAIYRKQNVGPRTMLPALWALDRILIFANKKAEAVAVSDEALALAGDLDTTPYADVANVLHELALIKCDQGNRADAEDLARKSVALHRRLHGDHHPETAWGLRSLGVVLAREKKHAEAEGAWREALTIFRHYYSNNYRGVEIALSGLREAMIAQGKTAALEALNREQDKLAGSDVNRHTDVAYMVRQLKDAPGYDAPQFELAESAATFAQDAPFAQRETIAAAILAHARGKSHWWNVDFQSTKRLADLAIQTYRPVATAIPSEANVVGLAESLCLAGWCQTKLGNFPESERTLREALEVLEGGVDHFGKNQSLRLTQTMAHRLLGDALARQTPTDEAIGHCHTAVAIISALNQEGPPKAIHSEQFVYARLCLADALISAGNLQPAVAEYRAAMAAIERAAAEYPGQIWVCELSADCLERITRELPTIAHKNPAESEEAHRLVTEASNQSEKLCESLRRPRITEQRTALAWGYMNAMVHLTPDADWAPEFDHAELAFRAVLAEIPDAAGAHRWRNLAGSLPRDGRNLPHIESALREAIRVFEHLLGEWPDDTENWLFLADTELWLGDICHKRMECKEAEAALRRAVEVFDTRGGTPAKRAESHLALASLLAEKDQVSEGIEHFQKAIEIQPDTAAAAHTLEWLATTPQATFRDPAKAVKFAQQAIDLEPNTGNCLNTLGVAQYRAGEFQKSIDALQKSMQMRGGGDGFDWFFLAMAHWQLGHKDEARTQYNKAVDWMDKNQPKNNDLLRFRREAEELLAEKPATDAKSTKPD